jgi:hypothetical protein
MFAIIFLQLYTSHVFVFDWSFLDRLYLVYPNTDVFLTFQKSVIWAEEKEGSTSSKILQKKKGWRSQGYASRKIEGDCD